MPHCQISSPGSLVVGTRPVDEGRNRETSFHIRPVFPRLILLLPSRGNIPFAAVARIHHSARSLVPPIVSRTTGCLTGKGQTHRVNRFINTMNGIDTSVKFPRFLARVLVIFGDSDVVPQGVTVKGPTHRTNQFINTMNEAAPQCHNIINLPQHSS